MKKNPGLVALLGALAQQTRQRGGSPSVQEIEASAVLVGQLLEQWSVVRGEARRHSLNGNDPELAVEIGKMDALIEQAAGSGGGSAEWFTVGARPDRGVWSGSPLEFGPSAVVLDSDGQNGARELAGF